MIHFIKYHPRKCASIIRSLSWILIIITILIGWNLFSGQVNIQNHIRSRYGLVLSRSKSQTVIKQPLKSTSPRWRASQHKAINACEDHYTHQEKIGCLTLLVAYLWWTFASLIIEDFFRPLIPIHLYVNHLKSKLKNS